MKTATLIYYLKAHGLPASTRAQREESTRAFQQAFAFYNIAVDGDAGPETHAAFRHSAKFGHRVSAHFKMREFRCGCDGLYHPAGKVLVHRDLLRALEKARQKLYPNGLRIVSGWRCVQFNKRIGGAVKSGHLTGRAADVPAKAGPTDFNSLGFHGIGYRPGTHGKVTHVDIAIGVRPNTYFKE